MRLATLLLDGHETVCCVSSDGQRCWPATDAEGAPYASMAELIRRVSAVPQDMPAGETFPLDPAMLRAPLVPARNIMCVGKNYGDHVREFAQSGFDSSGGKGAETVPEAPIIFTKTPETVIGPGEPIRIPHGLSRQVDYEAELAVVIGQGGRGIARGGDGACFRFYHCQRCHRARSATEARSVVPRQVDRRVLPDGPVDRHG